MVRHLITDAFDIKLANDKGSILIGIIQALTRHRISCLMAFGDEIDESLEVTYF